MMERVKRAIFNKLYQERKLPKVTKHEQFLIQELRTCIQSLSVGPDLGTDWQKNVDELKLNILTKDPRDFLGWDVIKRTMFFEPPIVEWNHVKKVFPPNVLIEDNIGRPKPYFAYRRSSGNLIHHAYSLSQLNNRVDLEEIDLIIEFGGGYGSMCRLINRLGYANKYIIFDLPIFLCLQQFFLVSCFGDKIKNNVIFASDISDVKQHVERVKKKKILFIATWSLSEAPVSLRDQTVNLIRDANYLIAFQRDFSGINNLDYFSQLEKKVSHVAWSSYPINHLPGHFYLIGANKLR